MRYRSLTDFIVVVVIASCDRLYDYLRTYLRHSDSGGFDDFYCRLQSNAQIINPLDDRIDVNKTPCRVWLVSSSLRVPGSYFLADQR